VSATPPDIQTVLDRPISERLREHKYRFAQCVVFGIPVIALHFLGPKLGGADAARWTGLLQSLLTGWIVYLGAIPLLAEGFLLIMHRQFKIDVLIGHCAVVLYIIGVAGWIMTVRGRTAFYPSAFSFCVIILVLWSGVQWLRLRSQMN
jgi:cation transport ATPase